VDDLWGGSHPRRTTFLLFLQLVSRPSVLAKNDPLMLDYIDPQLEQNSEQHLDKRNHRADRRACGYAEESTGIWLNQELMHFAAGVAKVILMEQNYTHRTTKAMASCLNVLRRVDISIERS